MKTHIVMPIGVSQPGTPVLDLLEKSIDSIQRQTSSNYILTVAADSNVPEDCKKLLVKKGVDIKWFESASFFRKGGIWKKISETWKTTDTKYLAFMHYDDLWDSKKLEMQVQRMEEEGLNSSWSEVYIIDSDGNIVSTDCAHIQEFDIYSAGKKTVAQAHSMIVKRDSFFDSGIMEFQDKWSPIFEDLFILFCNKIGKGKKIEGSKFFWRNHAMNMSNSILSDSKWKDLLSEQKKIGEYDDYIMYNVSISLDAVMRKIIQEIHEKN